LSWTITSFRHNREINFFSTQKANTMKDFMFIFRGPSPMDLDLSPEESQASMQKWFDWIGELSAKGHYVAGDPLAREGRTIQGKKPLVTDGPFAADQRINW
jgi:hypothetical protein